MLPNLRGTGHREHVVETVPGSMHAYIITEYKAKNHNYLLSIVVLGT